MLISAHAGHCHLLHGQASAVASRHGQGLIQSIQAEKFGLDELKRLALRKQGLQSGIQVDVILRSARFAYENTPDTDSRLRAHYLALIIRSRRIFKRSGTMQTEMDIGGSKLFFVSFSFPRGCPLTQG